MYPGTLARISYVPQAVACISQHGRLLEVVDGRRAGFRGEKTLEGIDFNKCLKLNRELIRDLAYQLNIPAA